LRRDRRDVNRIDAAGALDDRDSADRFAFGERGEPFRVELFGAAEFERAGRKHGREQERPRHRSVAALLENHRHVEHPESRAAEFLGNDEPAPSELRDLGVEFARIAVVGGHYFAHERASAFVAEKRARAFLELLLFFAESEIHDYSLQIWRRGTLTLARGAAVCL